VSEMAALYNSGSRIGILHSVTTHCVVSRLSALDRPLYLVWLSCLICPLGSQRKKSTLDSRQVQGMVVRDLMAEIAAVLVGSDVP
jgi:hypothetical protein